MTSALEPERKSSLDKHPSLLMLRHPFAGHALDFGNLAGAIPVALSESQHDERGGRIW